MITVLPQKIGMLYEAFGQPFHIFLNSGESFFALVDGLAEEEEGTGEGRRHDGLRGGFPPAADPAGPRPDDGPGELP